MMKKSIALVASVVALFMVFAIASPLAYAGDPTAKAPVKALAKEKAPAMEKSSMKEVTVKGWVRDPGCLLKMGMKGEKHSKCAAACAKAGQTLAIEDEKGMLWVVLADKEGGDPNAKLLEHAEHHVQVKGKITEKGGLKGIQVDSVEMAK